MASSSVLDYRTVGINTRKESFDDPIDLVGLLTFLFLLPPLIFFSLSSTSFFSPSLFSTRAGNKLKEIVRSCISFQFICFKTIENSNKFFHNWNWFFQNININFNPLKGSEKGWIFFMSLWNQQVPLQFTEILRSSWNLKWTIQNLFNNNSDYLSENYFFKRPH